MDQERVVSREEAAEWAKSRGMIFVETSAKTREGVSQVFSEVVQQVPDYCGCAVDDNCSELLPATRCESNNA